MRTCGQVLGLQADGTPMLGAYLGFGFRIAHQQLEAHQLRALAKETLVVRCRVTGASSLTSVDASSEAVERQQQLALPAVEVPPRSLANAWADLYASGDAADVAFACSLQPATPLLRAHGRARSTLQPSLPARHQLCAHSFSAHGVKHAE